MVILKTLMITGSLFGITSGSLSETALENMDQCKAYIQRQVDESYNTPKFTVKTKVDGYLDVRYANWPFDMIITHECVDLSK